MASSNKLQHYASTGQKHAKPIFWSAPSSAFSGKLRCYIAKSGMEVDERFGNEERFHNEIVPLIGYFVLPVLELQDGVLLQDTTEIMMYFETSAIGEIRRSLIPKTPIRMATAHLINLLGSDGFHKPGMHYRWTYEDKQSTFLDAAFADWVAPQAGVTRKEQTAYFTSDYLPALGINRDTIAAIEEAWEECLDILNKHFTAYPYILGSKPSIADCGLMTMIWAHLARDPVPAYLMRTRAPMVSRWVERLTQRSWFDGGFPNADLSDADDDDTLPETLAPFLRYLFARIAPETKASIASFDTTIKSSNLQKGDLLDGNAEKPNAHPGCGEIEFDLLGARVKRLAFVDTAFQFQTFQNALSSMKESEKRVFTDAMAEHGGESFLQSELHYAIGYHNYRYKLV